MATQSIDRPLSTSPEFGNGALTYGDKAIWVAIQGPGQDSGSSESYTHRKATEAAALLPLAPAPSSGDAALGDSEAFIMQRSESLRTAWGGRGWASASLTQHLQTPNTGSYTAGGGGAPRPNPDLWGTQQCLRRRPRRNSPPGSVPRATAISHPVSVTAAGRQLPATTSGSTSAERGMLGERPRVPRSGAARGSPWW